MSSNAAETPLLDLLREIPEDARMVYEHDSMRSQNIPVGRLCQQAIAEIKRLRTEKEDHQKAAAWCEKHAPRGGHRPVCVVCAGEKLSAALSRISYLCGTPNVMGMSTFDVFPDEDAVVVEVESLRAERDDLQRQVDKLSGQLVGAEIACDETIESLREERAAALRESNKNLSEVMRLRAVIDASDDMRLRLLNEALSERDADETVLREARALLNVLAEHAAKLDPFARDFVTDMCARIDARLEGRA